MRREILEPTNTKACKKCPLYYERHGRTHFVPTEVRRNKDGEVDIAFIHEAPSKTDDEQGLPAVGKSGQLHRKLVKMTHGSENGVAHMLAVRCGYGPQKWVESSAPKAAKICRKYMLQELEELKPKVIVTMGNGSLRSLFKDTRLKVTNERGHVSVEEVGDHSAVVMPTFHASSALRSPALASTIKTDIWRAAMIAKHGYDDELPTAKKGKSVLLTTVKDIAEMVDYALNDLDEEDAIAIDIEAKNVNKRYGNKVATIQLAWGWKKGYVIPYAHPETPFDPVELKQVRKLVRKLFRAKARFKYWIAHNCKFEDMVLRQEFAAYPSNAPLVDTQHMLFLLDENRLGLREKRGSRNKPGNLDPFSLEKAAIEFLEFYHYTRREKDDLRADIMNSPLAEVAEYGGKDAYVTRRLFDVLQLFCEPDYVESMMRLTEHLYAPAAHAFAVAESNGFLVNRDRIRELLDPHSPLSISGRINEINSEIRGMPAFQEANDRVVGDKLGKMRSIFKKPWAFDFAKQDHQRTLFFDVLGLEPVSYTKTKLPSVNKTFQKEYWNEKEGTGVKEVGIFHELQLLDKMESTYLTALLERVKPGGEVDSQDCRIRPNYGLTNTVTARTNSSKPNLQQIPRADNPVKKAIKSLFCAAPGTILVQGDFMAFEVRWLAIAAQDPALGEIFWRGKDLRDAFRKNPSGKLKLKAEFEGDVHKNTAASAFGIPLREVTKQQRTAAKAIVFGSAYGKHIKTLARDLKITVEEAEAIDAKIFGAFRRVQNWFDATEHHGMTHGWVESPLGRRRRINEFLVGDLNRGKRLARNSPIQSAASDTCLVALGLLQQYIERKKLQDRWLVINAVHDSFLLQVPREDLRKVLKATERIFTDDVMDFTEDVFGVNFDVCPLEVDYEIGTEWGNMVKWDLSEPCLERVEKWLDAAPKAGSKKDKRLQKRIDNWPDFLKKAA